MDQTTLRSAYLLRPAYYPQFSCLAGDCPDHCCKGWLIEIDPQTREKWESLTEKVPASDHPDMPIPCGQISSHAFTKTFIRYHIRMTKDLHCPFQNADGLCSIVLSHGDACIPAICRDYPRHHAESGPLLQDTLSIRCAPVLDLLWSHDRFDYSLTQLPSDVHRSGVLRSDALPDTNAPDAPASGDLIQENTIPDPIYPAKKLLDLLLHLGNTGRFTAGSLLFAVFDALYRTHQRLEKTIPIGPDGVKEYGTEWFTPETIAETITHVNTFVNEQTEAACTLQNTPISYETLYHGHCLFHQIVREFLDNPVFQTDFKEALQRSKQLLHLAAGGRLASVFEARFGQPSPSIQMLLDPQTDRRLTLMILEELFSSVFSIETADYESALLHTQWLTAQFVAIRHLLLLDLLDEKPITDALTGRRISRIFRVTDLPDIQKIAFFDEAFKNWLRTPDEIRRRLF